MCTQEILQTRIPLQDSEEPDRESPPSQERRETGETPASAGRPLILPPLRKKIYNIFQTRKDTIFETDIKSGLFHSVLFPLLREDAQQTGRKPLLIVPSSVDADEFHADYGLTAETPAQVIDSLRRNASCFQNTKRVVIACPAETACADFCADIQFIYAKAGFSPHTLVFTENVHRGMHPVKKLLFRPKMIARRDMAALKPGKGNTAVDAETVREFLIEANKQLFREDPSALRAYRKLFTKNIPFFRRSDMAACLLKFLLEKNPVSFIPAARKVPSRPDMKMIFFGLGKNRKVFPRDITGLILNKYPRMNRDDIGDIRILDSYSFVEITESRVDDVIEALNGTEYRGKTLAVNYARKKEDALQD